MGYESRRYAYSVARHPHDWPSIFRQESALIKAALDNNLLYVEHVGSTAVPGAAGRATLDLIAVVDNMSDIAPCLISLKSIGYEEGEKPWLKHGRFFKKDIISPHGGWERAVDLYVLPEEHPQMMQMLDVREYLKAHPEEARHFEDHKHKVFKKNSTDYFAYQEDKEDYMEKLIERAEAWSGKPAEKGWPASE